MALVADKHVLILQDHKHIAKLFGEGIFKEHYFEQLLKTIGADMVLGNVATSTKKKSSFRIIIDPHHGIQDLEQRKLCAVGTADKRFQEDALRIIRALRFVSVLNQKLSTQKK